MAAEKLNAVQLIALAKSNGPGLAESIEASLGCEGVEGRKGLGWTRARFFLCYGSGFGANLFIDDAAGPKMKSVAGSKLWYGVARIDGLGKSTLVLLPGGWKEIWREHGCAGVYGGFVYAAGSACGDAFGRS